MKRTIVGYHLDAEGDRVAELDCAHGQHVRHRPPLSNRRWTETAAGRDSMLGTVLDCVRCDRMEFPDGLVGYRETPVFDQDTLPKGLRRRHSTATGVWGLIHVLDGRLEYSVEPPADRTFEVAPGDRAVVVPGLEHAVSPVGDVRFFVEFWRRAAQPDD